MKNNIQSLRVFSLILFLALSCQFSTTFAQDSLYIYQGGIVVAKRAVLEIDSITFTAPVVPIKSSECGAYLGPDNTLYKQFLCRNLGAAGDLYSGGLSYDVADNGDLYQWGRATDGHEKRNSVTTEELAMTNTPEHANFILAPTSPSDWRSGGGNDNRWGESTKAANDPCPNGYKVPSIAQWDAVVAANNNAQSAWTNGYKFGDNLFLPAAGYRITEVVEREGLNAYYWSSSVWSTQAKTLSMSNGVVNRGDNNRSNGFSVRCIVE